jgi:sugar phosphate permease
MMIDDSFNAQRAYTVWRACGDGPPANAVFATSPWYRRRLLPSPQPPPPKRWTSRIFAASWVSYFSYYFTRKNFSAVKSSIGLAEGWLKWIDVAYLVGYCLGQFLAGALGDVVGARRMVTAGMIATAVITVVFASAHSITSSVIAVYVACSALNGLVQATGWPGNGKLMATWFPAATRGEVMGYWGTCYQLGGFAATAAAGWLLHWGWQTVYYAMATWVASVAIGYWFSVRDRPSDVGFADPEVEVGLSAQELAARRREQWPRLLKNPMTYAMGMAYFGLKLMRYGFLFWLPYYLNVSLHYGKSESAYVSLAFELGGVVFVVIAGLIADRLLGKRRILVAAMSSFLLFFALYAYREFGASGEWQNIGILMLVGGFLFSADTLVSGAAAQDLGGPHAAALACGLINGIGSVGAVVQALALIPIKNTWGWDGVFVLFQAMAVLSFLPLLPFLKVRPPQAQTA